MLGSRQIGSVAIVACMAMVGTLGGGTASAAQQSSRQSLANASLPKSMHVGAIFLDAQGFYGGVKYGFETAAAADHVSLSLIQSNVADDVSSEANLLQEMTAAHVQAIIISAASATASVPAIAVASKAGIPVICYNTCINTAAMNKYVYAFALGDPVLFGQLLGGCQESTSCRFTTARPRLESSTASSSRYASSGTKAFGQRSRSSSRARSLPPTSKGQLSPMPFQSRKPSCEPIPTSQRFSGNPAEPRWELWRPLRRTVRLARWSCSVAT